ncbi:hypothetical protein [Dokdonella soli]|uniref:Uncharacterized protein n=1 Tax=Dokdonella soli TaxID=529810 RepID=A0ABN1IGQ2_9GAMM
MKTALAFDQHDMATRWVDDVPAVEVGPGCFRRDLPSDDGVRVWVVDMRAGAE